MHCRPHRPLSRRERTCSAGLGDCLPRPASPRTALQVLAAELGGELACRRPASRRERTCIAGLGDTCLTKEDMQCRPHRSHGGRGHAVRASGIVCLARHPPRQKRTCIAGLTALTAGEDMQCGPRGLPASPGIPRAALQVLAAELGGELACRRPASPGRPPIHR
jgi:hypothetical protein